MIYARRASPLHVTRPAVAMAWCAALAGAALVVDEPIVLASLLLATVLAGVAAGISDRLWRTARFAVPLAVLVAVINPLLTREGLTLIANMRMCALPFQLTMSHASSHLVSLLSRLSIKSPSRSIDLAPVKPPMVLTPTSVEALLKLSRKVLAMTPSRANIKKCRNNLYRYPLINGYR